MSEAQSSSDQQLSRPTLRPRTRRPNYAAIQLLDPQAVDVGTVSSAIPVASSSVNTSQNTSVVIPIPFFIEGNHILFPADLHTKLQDFHHNDSEHWIPCSANLWPHEGELKMTLFVTAKGQGLQWVIAGTNDVVKIGRFGYWKRRQLLVVQHANINQGKPCFIECHKKHHGQGIQLPQNGLSRWRVWDDNVNPNSLTEIHKVTTAPTVILTSDLDSDPVRESTALLERMTLRVTLKVPRIGAYLAARESHPDREHPLTAEEFLQNNPRPDQVNASENTAVELTPVTTNLPHSSPAQSLAAPALPPTTTPTVEDIDVIFYFKYSETIASVRSRPYSKCRSVRMLYNQAASAGIAAHDTALLVVKVGQCEPRTVVKDDDEDFVTVASDIELESASRGGDVLAVSVWPFEWSET